MSVIEKVGRYHPDKLADRCAGAIVDLAYRKAHAPRVAVELLAGHNSVTAIIESSITLDRKQVERAISRITGIQQKNIVVIQVAQDPILSNQQLLGYRCGDNGRFACRWNPQYEQATELVAEYDGLFISDAKYLIDLQAGAITACVSQHIREDITSVVARDFQHVAVNPLGDWYGGLDVDTGAVNRKLGSDQPLVAPNGIHGKDLSKADVSVTIVLTNLSRKLGGTLVESTCSIGDSEIPLYVDGELQGYLDFTEVVESAGAYIHNLGGFEAFASYGFRWPQENQAQQKLLIEQARTRRKFFGQQAA